jgi:hypothetical protein
MPLQVPTRAWSSASEVRDPLLRIGCVAVGKQACSFVVASHLF